MQSNNETAIPSAGFISSRLQRISLMREIGVLIPLVLLIITFGVLNNAFVSGENIINILRSTSFTFIVGIGMTIVLISAGLDLSVGSQLALGAVTTAALLHHGVPIVIGIFAGLAVGLLIGLINGAIIVKLRIPPFITTLGMLYMARGVVLITTHGVPIYPLPESFNSIGQEGIWQIPYIVILAVVFGLAGDFVLRRTVYGRTVYAIGGNEETARLSGIKVDGIKLSVYMLVGALATLTGLLQAARLGSGQPSMGNGFELEVIAAVIIGGTSLFGGAGTILGTFLGALFMVVLKNGMSLVHVSAYWQQLVTGAIIIVAVGIDQYRRRQFR
jgi:ribose/xylose/arabinose/galactoside ABC-type transport system permease subunit